MCDFIFSKNDWHRLSQHVALQCCTTDNTLNIFVLYDQLRPHKANDWFDIPTSLILPFPSHHLFQHYTNCYATHYTSHHATHYVTAMLATTPPTIPDTMPPTTSLLC